MSIGHALPLNYYFEGGFGEGDLAGKAFNGQFQYDTNKDRLGQIGYFEVTVEGISYVDGAVELTVDNTNIDGQITYQLNPFIKGAIELDFDELNPDLSQPLPLDFIISKIFVFELPDPGGPLKGTSESFNLSLY